MYSLRSKRPDSWPQASSESGASGSSRWTATSKSGWSAGTHSEPAGIRRVSALRVTFIEVTSVAPW